MALASCLATAIAGVVFGFAATFTGLLAAQIFLIIGRSMFWPATWSLGTQIPGDRSRQLGRLNAVTSAGQIAGTIAAGWMIAKFGFRIGFGAFVAANVVAFVLLAMFKAPPSDRRDPQPIVATYLKLLRRRSIYFAIMCAYISALPFSLSASFYPILLVEHDYSSGAAGWLIALRAVGQVAAGIGVGRYLRHTSGRTTPLVSALSVALCVALVAWAEDPIAVGVFLLGVGLGSGVMTLYFQMLISDLSSTAERGSAMAMGGLGWGLSHLSTPVLMGLMQDHFGIQRAFYVMGGVATLWGLLLIPMHRWAFLKNAEVDRAAR